MRTTLTLTFIASLALAGCSGGGTSGSQVSSQILSQSPGGIYRGKATTASGAVVDSLLIVSEDGRFIGVAENPANSCADVAQGSMTMSNATFTGGGNVGEINYMTVPAAETDCEFADGSIWGTSTVAGSFVSQTSLTLTSTNTTSMGTASTGSPVTFTYDKLYNESANLSKTTGNWTGQTGSVISINADGVVSSQDSNTGCVLNGQLSVINPLYDVYSVTVTFSNCTVDAGAAYLNGGTAIGLVALNDTVVPNELYVGYTLTTSSGTSYMVATVATR